jgi:hypothetical protein
MKVEEAKPERPLSMQQVAAVLEKFTSTGAEWFMSPASFLNEESFYRQPRQIDLVVWLDGQEQGRWRLLPASFGSLVTRHTKAPGGTFAIPHASGYQYDEYQLLKPLKQRAQVLLDSLAPPLNALWERVYSLDDTPGVPLTLADDWWRQARQVLENTWWSRLRELQKQVGAPHYLQHTSQLAEVLPKAQEGLNQLRKFLQEVPPPSASTAAASGAELTLGDGARYQFRHIVSPDINSSGTYFTSKFGRSDFGMVPFNVAEVTTTETPVLTSNSLREQLLDVRERIDQILSQLE